MERTGAIGVEQMTDEKPKTIGIECPNCDEDFEWDISGELNDAFEQGKLAVLNEMDKLIMGTSTIDALEGGVIALDCYYIHADRYNKLKSQLEKEGVKK